MLHLCVPNGTVLLEMALGVFVKAPESIIAMAGREVESGLAGLLRNHTEGPGTSSEREESDISSITMSSCLRKLPAAAPDVVTRVDENAVEEERKRAWFSSELEEPDFERSMPSEGERERAWLSNKTEEAHLVRHTPSSDQESRTSIDTRPSARQRAQPAITNLAVALASANTITEGRSGSGAAGLLRNHNGGSGTPSESGAETPSEPERSTISSLTVPSSLDQNAEEEGRKRACLLNEPAAAGIERHAPSCDQGSRTRASAHQRAQPPTMNASALANANAITEGRPGLGFDGSDGPVRSSWSESSRRCEEDDEVSGDGVVDADAVALSAADVPPSPPPGAVGTRAAVSTATMPPDPRTSRCATRSSGCARRSSTPSAGSAALRHAARLLRPLKHRDEAQAVMIVTPPMTLTKP